jgi:opine dehydrogenase
MTNVNKNNGPIAIVGAGNGGLAIAANLALKGAAVHVYDKFSAIVDPIKEAGGVFLEGPNLRGFASFAKVTDNISEAVDGAKLIMVVTPASLHAAVAADMAPYLPSETTIVLNPGRTGGALEVRNILREHCPNKQIVVAETQTLLYACRKITPIKVVVKGEKRVVPVAAIPASQTPKVVENLNRFFPQFVAARNILETGFSNIGSIFHPTPTIFNMGWIETTQGNFEYYHQGISKSLSELLEKLDAERLAVAQAYNISVLSAREWLQEAYGVSDTCLYGAIQKNHAYHGITAPHEINVRYISEDVPTGLVPIACLGKAADIPTPLMDSVINIASNILGINFWETGRNEKKLGLSNLGKAAILEVIQS